MTEPTSPLPATPPSPRRVPVQRRRSPGRPDVGGLPLVTLHLGTDGTPEPGALSALVSALDTAVATDVLFLCHGSVDPLSRSFLGSFPALLRRFGRPGHRVVLVDVRWPGRRWPDEPVPALGAEGSILDTWFGLRAGTSFAAPAPPDAPTRAWIRSAFDPGLRARVDELLGLLVARPDAPVALRRARALVRELAEAAPDTGDGERHDVTSVLEIDDPQPDQLFADFTLALSDLGVLTEPGHGTAGYGDGVPRLWHGAQEAVRQLTYWQVKRRAAEVGVLGLGPLLARLHRERPRPALDLVGHGLGARVVAHALRALPEPPAHGPAPVRSVTLLQAAFSQYAFADELPFDRSRSGLLASTRTRISGPVTACWSRHDPAVGTFYRLAARAVGPAGPTGGDIPAHRWGTLGRNGHQPAARNLALHRPGVPYDFGQGGLVGIDASRVVRRGAPPGGAHADICHPELAWIVLSAAGLC